MFIEIIDGSKIIANSLDNCGCIMYYYENNIKLEFTCTKSIYIYKNNEYNREDGPALINSSYKRYFINGLSHREDGPAIEYTNGDKQWHVHGKLHRIKGPAIETISINKKEYYKHNLRHRFNAPAIMDNNNFSYYEYNILKKKIKNG